MKYIVYEEKIGSKIISKEFTIKEDGIEAIIVFPKFIPHRNIAKFFTTIISAGEINEKYECFGNSGSLKLKSRGKTDTLLFKKSINDKWRV